MLTQINKADMSNANKSVELEPKLGNYIDAVAMLKPLCNFIAGDSNITEEWREYIAEDGSKGKKIFKFLYSVEVYENGEHLGNIGIAHIYRRAEGGNIPVYFVDSFRISKERGQQNRTFSKHLKVALREANKAFIPRANQELIAQISQHVSFRLGHVISNNYNQARWCIDCDTEAMNYAYLAYKARLRGETTVTLPTVLSTANSKRNDRDFDKYMERYDESKKLTDHYNNIGGNGNIGYAVQAKADKSFVVCNYDKNDPNTLYKYKSLDDMPKHLADKISALKLLSIDEPVGHIGVKLHFEPSGDTNVEYYYLVSGDIIFE
jgi:hypothetical protein